MIRKCEYCGKEFNAKSKSNRFCSNDCCNKARYKKLCEDRSKYLKENCIENEDYVIDQWNGYAVICLYGPYFRSMHPNRTLIEYKKEFPNARTCSIKHSKATSKNAGQFMKEEKYRKMYSEKFKGENNPNHRSKTTEQQRKERSPFCKEFYEKHDGDRNEFIKNVSENRSYNTRIDYYTNLGMTEEEAQEALRKRQSTFTLEKCIERLGEEEGIRIFKERQDKWAKSCGLNGFEHKFIDKIITFCRLDENETQTYKDKQLLLRDRKLGKSYFYDFVYKNKIIEINGDFWHMNSNKFKADDYNNMMHKTAKEIWDESENKLNLAKSSGYDVLVVWESDIRKNENQVLDEIKKFLQN